MILCLSKGRNDPKDLKGVLPVLDRRLDDGGDGGVVLHACLGAEAPADLEFGLGRPERLLAVVVRGRDIRIGQEGEDVVPVFCNTLLEFVKFRFLPVFGGVDRWPCEQLVQPLFHLRADLRPEIPLVPLMDGVPQEVQHVQAPGVVRESLHGISEVPKQVRDAYLVVLHSHITHKVGRKPVRHPDHSTLLSPGEVLVHDIVAAALVEGEIRGDRVLEGPEPVVLAADVDSGLVRSGHLPARDPLADHLVGSLGEFAHRVQHVGHGALADVKTEDGLVQVREPLERDVLIGAQIRGHGHDVGAVGYRCIHILRKLTLAAVTAGALDLHLKMVEHLGRNGKRDVHHLAPGAHRGRVHVQRLSALRAHCRRIPAFRAGDILGLEPGTALMPLLATGLSSGRLAQRLRMRDAYRILGRRNAAVRAGLGNRFHAAFKFRDTGLQLFNLFILADKIAVQDVNNKRLLMQLLCKFRRVKVLGETHIPKELLAPPGEFHPVSFKALAEPGIEVFSHTTKVRKRFDIYKFNILIINRLKAICGLYNESDRALFGGPDEKFLRALNRPQMAVNRLIFSGLKTRFAA